ncbi:DNA cytosine methyltransferase [Streptomyces scopuliridis]|uniref:DNA cytosine methyltransferase n=1 Tax=Streptomyces scopuliridis TaxID=452529 RepID=UPI00344AB9CB
MTTTDSGFASVEICAGAGGQASGLHDAGFRHHALIEIDEHACATLKANVDESTSSDGAETTSVADGEVEEESGSAVIRADLTEFDPGSLGLEEGVLDLLAGGVPCPPFSVAGKQLGQDDERDLFPTMLSMIEELSPKAVMIENVRGLLDQKFERYREDVIERRLEDAGYKICFWDIVEACDYGVPQLRPRAILLALREPYAKHFVWREPEPDAVLTVADALAPSMYERFRESGEDPRWKGKYAQRWKIAYDLWLEKARSSPFAPTLVGGSKKHGGADLGPTRAKVAWEKLGVCGLGVANDQDKMTDPERDLYAKRGPKLTVRQAAIIQGFPATWKILGRKTAAYRQVGNAFPPPVAKAMGEMIIEALEAEAKSRAVPYELPIPSALRAEPADRGSDLERACIG